MKIGTFKLQETGVYKGTLSVLSGTHPLEIRPTGGNQVQYEVFMGQSGQQIGAGWTKTSEKGNEYISIQLNDPFLVEPINANLITKDSSVDLLWTPPHRRRKQQSDD